MSQQQAANSTGDSYDLRRGRREQARVRARALARVETWEEVYMADVEGDGGVDDDDVSISTSYESETSPATHHDHVDLQKPSPGSIN